MYITCHVSVLRDAGNACFWNLFGEQNMQGGELGLVHEIGGLEHQSV